MNFAIRYLTEYTYAGRVTDNLNALRVRPATTSTQRVDDFHVRVFEIRITGSIPGEPDLIVRSTRRARNRIAWPTE